MDDLLREFLAETNESIDVVDVELVRFEQDPNNAKILGNIFRLVHTIKGTCGFLNLPRLEALTHAAEALMGRFRDGVPVTSEAVSLILATIDRIKALLDELERNQAEQAGDDGDLIAQLHTMTARAKAAPAAAGKAAEPPPPQVLERPLRPGEVSLDELQEGVMKTRMQPIGNAWQKLPRVVRDLSTELGKPIEFEMHGADTELDRQVLDLIKDPLIHMVRNSADHGIESPAERRAAGKPEKGTIRLSAWHQGGQILI